MIYEREPQYINLESKHTEPVKILAFYAFCFLLDFYFWSALKKTYNLADKINIWNL